jgi:hypothetical protein
MAARRELQVSSSIRARFCAGDCVVTLDRAFAPTFAGSAPAHISRASLRPNVSVPPPLLECLPFSVPVRIVNQVRQ